MSTIGKRLLFVDDDEQLVALLAMRLGKSGYAVDYASRPEDGCRLALDKEYDAIILDVVMPNLGGIDICSALRLNGVLTPILFLSGQTEKRSIIKGLSAGGDDYLTKPFDDDELIARINALLRRNNRTYTSELLERDGLVLDVPARTASAGAHAVSLTQKETLLLKRLMSEAPRPLSRLLLLQDVWGIGGAHASNRLDVYVRRLRQKMLALSGKEYIHTIRSGGYYFDS